LFEGENMKDRLPAIIYLTKRIMSSLFTLFLILTVVFLLLRLLPDERYFDETPPKGFNESQVESWKISKLQKLGFYDEDKIRLNKFEQLINYYYQVFPFRKEICVKEGYVEFGSSEKICIKAEIIYKNWGKPIFYKPVVPVQQIVKDRFPISFYITMASMAITYTVAYPIGVSNGKKKRKINR